MTEWDVEGLSDEEAKRFPTWGLDVIVLDDLKVGSIVTAPPSYTDEMKKTVHYDIKHLRHAMKEIYNVYSKKGTREDFVKVLEKVKHKRDDDIHDFMGRVENIGKTEKLFKVIQKTKKGNEVILKFQEVNQDEKKKLIKSIVKKVVDKVSKKQLSELFEQSIMKLNDLDELKKVDKALNKKNPSMEGNRGCYKLVIEDIDLFIVG